MDNQDNIIRKCYSECWNEILTNKKYSNVFHVKVITTKGHIVFTPMPMPCSLFQYYFHNERVLDNGQCDGTCKLDDAECRENKFNFIHVPGSKKKETDRENYTLYFARSASK